MSIARTIKPTTLLLGNGSYVNIRANSTCDRHYRGPISKPYISPVQSPAQQTREQLDNIVSNAGTGISGRVATFSSDKVIQDGGTLLSDLATTAAMTTADNLRLLKSGGTMTGSIAMGAFDLTNVGNISGGTNSRTADNIVSNAGTSVSGNIASLSGTTGKVITDSGVAAASVVVGPAVAVSGNLPTFSGTTGKLVADSGILASSLATTAAMNTADNLRLLKAGDTMSGALAMGTNNITNVGSISGATYTRSADNILSCTTLPTYGNLAMFSATSKGIDDSFISSFSVVTGPASAVNNQVALFNGTTGKAIQVGTTAIGTLGALTLANTTVSTTTGTGSLINAGGFGNAGAAYIGGIIRGLDTTNSSSSSTGSIIASGGLGVAKTIFAGDITDSSSTSTGTIITNGGIGVAKKAYIGDNIVIGTNQTRIIDTKLTMQGTASNIAGPHKMFYTTTDQYPVFQQLNWDHNNVALNFDSYYSGSNWTSAYVSSNYQIYKVSNQLQFNYGSGVAAGSTVTFSTAGYVNTSGNLIWNNNVLAGTTSASAKIVASGGIQNIGSEESCIRAISALNSAKIEIQCTGASGRLYEMRATNNGNFDITDRSGSAARLTIDTLGNMGVGMTPTGGGNNGVFIGNGAGPTTIPSSGGALYVATGRLFYRGSSGTVTQLAVA